MEIKRKKWTPQADVTTEVLKFREKRKWQLAFRRYVIEQKSSLTYAPYFGLDINQYRRWVELQFTEGINWGNFGKAWQFEHVIPVAYFDFNNNEDLILCWNFINIRVAKMDADTEPGNRIDLLAAKPYFENLYGKTGYSTCLQMVNKINGIQAMGSIAEPQLEQFIIEQKQDLENLKSLTAEEFSQLNNGVSLADVMLEREILKKFG